MTECDNIERAFKAWIWEPATIDHDWLAARQRTQDGDEFLAVVEGYENGPAGRLAEMIVEYNLAMVAVNVVLTERAPSASDIAVLEGAIDKVSNAYDQHRREICS